MSCGLDLPWGEPGVTEVSSGPLVNLCLRQKRFPRSDTALLLVLEQRGFSCCCLVTLVGFSTCGSAVLPGEGSSGLGPGAPCRE